MTDDVHGTQWQARIRREHERHAGIPDYGYCPGRGPRADVAPITSAMLEKQRAEFRAARYRRIMIGPSFPFPHRRAYRVYGDGREFGIDYTRDEAFAAREKYAREFPDVTYYVRRVR